MTLKIRNAEVAGEIRDVEVSHWRRLLVDGTYIDAPDAVVEIDAEGCALIPGLHDHHIHLAALAARTNDCSTISSVEEFSNLLRGATGDWVRVTGYHESIAGELDRQVLDRLGDGRPIRVQHRSGALWILNSAALDAVAAVLDSDPDIERAPDGTPNGRLWRFDSRLRPALPHTPPDLAAVGDRLFRAGITGVTDATPDLNPAGIEMLVEAHRSGSLPQDLVLLGAPDEWCSPLAGIKLGPAKLLLRDHDLPDVDEVIEWITARHHNRRPVAIHCVTSDALAIILAAFETAGTIPGDRLEHGAIVPDGLLADLAQSGLRVVTNPGFLQDRGDSYVQDVNANELPFLYRYQTLIKHGIPTVAASDAPYGPTDPWQVIEAAISRKSRSGTVIGTEEAVSALSALAGFWSPADRPGDIPTPLLPGRTGGLCLLKSTLSGALATPSNIAVRLVTSGSNIASLGPN